AGLASALGPVALGIVSQEFGLRGMFAFAALIAALAAAVLVVGVEDSHTTSRPVADRAPERLKRVVKWLDEPPRKPPKKR
ncbi:MAG TPA: hypothetical protein VM328_03255, partial [Fimbriimonadaceae bacterium]|nr:hypothetical protein [Fimbriimonadaceae bacterium]